MVIFSVHVMFFQKDYVAQHNNGCYSFGLETHMNFSFNMKAELSPFHKQISQMHFNRSCFIAFEMSHLMEKKCRIDFWWGVVCIPLFMFLLLKHWMFDKKMWRQNFKQILFLINSAFFKIWTKDPKPIQLLWMKIHFLWNLHKDHNLFVFFLQYIIAHT